MGGTCNIPSTRNVRTDHGGWSIYTFLNQGAKVLSIAEG